MTPAAAAPETPTRPTALRYSSAHALWLGLCLLATLLALSAGLAIWQRRELTSQALTQTDLIARLAAERTARYLELMQPAARPDLHWDGLVTQIAADLSGPQQSATLLTASGQVLMATEQASVQAGEQLAAQHPLRRINLHTTPTVSDLQGASDDDAIRAWRQVDATELMLVVEQPQSALTRLWQHDLNALLLGTLLLGGLIVAGTWGGWRSLREHEHLSDELAKASAKLQDNEHELRVLIEAAPAPMFMLDGQGRYALINRAFEDFFGVRRHELIGTDTAPSQVLRRLAFHPERDTQLWAGAGRSHYLDELPVADGARREVLVAKVAVPGDQSSTRAVIGSITDVTELRQAERHTRLAMEAAEHANDIKNEFIANMSHGLRTPLQTVLGFSELGRERADENRHLADMFDGIHDAGQRMLRLVDDLLDLALLENSLGSIRPETADSVALVQHLLKMLAPVDTAHALRLHLTQDTGLCQIDPQRFQQALRNVLDNALSHTPPGQTVDISLQTLPDGDVHWRIRDHGPGLADSELPLLFDPFFDGRRQHTDTSSLGLTISHKIVQAHGGRLWVDNHPDGGAVFNLVFPAPEKRS